MTENKIFWIFVAFFVACVVLVGLVGGDCVRECQATGEHSDAVCFNICRQ